MSEIVDIGMGNLTIASAPSILTTSSIGSCVAVCLYSHFHKAGGLAHVMLPARPENTTPLTDADHKYADIAISVMVTSLEQQGITRQQLIAKIIGGANMFPSVQGRSHKIGDKNVESIKAILTSVDIKLAAEETGGCTGRALTFDLANGIVTVKITI